MATKTFHRGIRDMKIAAWNGVNSFGTAYDVLGARRMAVTLTIETDELRGDDAVLDRYSKFVAATFSLEHASVDLETLDIMLGGTLVSNASYEDFLLGQDDNIPYIAVAGRVVGSDVEDLHFFGAKCKVAGNFDYQAQIDQYLIPRVDFQAVHEGTVNGIIRMRKFMAATALEIPLRTTTGGL
jgi:hypothetical protein